MSDFLDKIKSKVDRAFKGDSVNGIFAIAWIATLVIGFALYLIFRKDK